ncbi:MAG: hypothetical protein KC657_04015 [Myxococcales bacterium]|nr:hypothetical protein [Myxococcales bacterium]
MIEKLDFLVRFWELKARNASLGSPLTAQEQLELLSLMQLVTQGLEVPTAGPVPRPKGALPAELIGDGGIISAEVRALNASVVVVTCAPVLPKGARVILRATDAVSAVEYALPCSIVWVHRGSPTTLALAVDGIPTRERFEVTETRMTSGLALGKRERLVG